VKEFLGEELEEIEVPDDISKEALAEAFCKYVEDDYYEWLKDNFKSFFNYGKPDWKWVRERIEKLRPLKKIIKSPRYPQIIPQNKNT
jgi:hypothetical protein